jgi:UDP-N-acetyl-D-galactosamine dehydrogenase
VCLPILEQVSGLVFNQDFYLGYSPERINPGDKTKRIADIVKVTSGSTPEMAARIDALYASVITAGTYMAPSIKVAEAAKVIENAQRDINIAFVNELSQIFNLMDIDTKEVLAAAKTKWNFLDFHPGLVGGNCFGVDPYYLAHKAKSLGYTPNVILAGREINDGMARYVGQQIINKLEQGAIDLKKARILVLGITFKPNCPDIRNSKVVDLINYLLGQCASVTVADPWAYSKEVQAHYGLELLNLQAAMEQSYDCCVYAVRHDVFEGIEMNSKMDYRW